MSCKAAYLVFTRLSLDVEAQSLNRQCQHKLAISLFQLKLGMGSQYVASIFMPAILAYPAPIYQKQPCEILTHVMLQ